LLPALSESSFVRTRFCAFVLYCALHILMKKEKNSKLLAERKNFMMRKTNGATMRSFTI
jgi:hypothetical protein